MLTAYRNHLQARSVAILRTLDTRTDRIVIGWLIVAALGSALRVIPSSLRAPISAGQLLPYCLLILAPAASMVLALRWFSNGDLQPQPATRLARVGKWVSICREAAERHPLYGTSGIMVSLLVGMLANVPVRAAEYLVAMPPIPEVAPHWLSTLHFTMTLDVVLFSSLYSIAFVAALRRVPLFPRLLLAIWFGDLAMQMVTAHLAANTHLPANVAAALQTMLTGNVKKTLISIGLWLPYLLLSTRVNVTYRHRVPA